MTKTKFISIGFGLLVMALFMSSLITTTAGDNGIGYNENNGIVTITTSNVTITVQTKNNMPMFHYSSDGLTYTVLFKQLIEYYDLNDDGAFQYVEVAPGVPILSLTSVSWLFGGFETETDANGTVVAVHFNFTSTNVMQYIYRDLDMVIAAHLYLYDTEIDGYTIAGGTELKFDIIINNYPWVKADSKLALRFDITPSGDAEIRDNHGKPIDTSTNSTNNERRMEHQKGVKQEIQIQQGDKTGYFAYANQSRIRTTAENQYRNAVVNASLGTAADGTVRVFLSFEHFEQLIYDPSVGSTTTEGSTEEENEVETSPIPVAFIGIIAAMAVGVALTKKFNNK